MTTPLARRVGPRWVVGLALAVAGCSAPEPPPCRVTGSVTVNGKPAERATVRLHLASDPVSMHTPEVGRTEADGTFRTKVRGPGEYAVTVFWPAVTTTEPGGKGEEIEGDDRLGGRYDKPTQPAARVTIRDGDNALQTIALKAP